MLQGDLTYQDLTLVFRYVYGNHATGVLTVRC